MEKLEGTMLSEIYDLEAIPETWWGEFHDHSMAINAQRLLRRDRGGSTEGGDVGQVKSQDKPLKFRKIKS